VARYVNYEGIEVVGTSVEVPDLPWLYISEVSVASALGQLRGLAILAAAVESLFALLLVAIVWTVARSIVAPLLRLVVAADRIRKGDLGVEVEIKRDDELGHLGRTFNQMSNELHSSARKIQELHEQEMRRAAQLASVGELASGIAHEIKNPLVGVASGVDLLSRQVGEDPKSAAILDLIYAQVRRIESALQDLLSYASPKEPLFTWTDPKQLVERLIALVRPQADAAGVQITERLVDSLPTIRVDPELLTQALVNLALNAIQAMEPGGVLQISLERVDDRVFFSISDTGEGIRSDEIDRIYRPFYTTKHRGTGLGLAITRGIVERHGGQIEIESKLGEGTTFTLILPPKPQEALVR
jgi:signal transduction histidine kinase